MCATRVLTLSADRRSVRAEGGVISLEGRRVARLALEAGSGLELRWSGRPEGVLTLGKSSWMTAHWLADEAVAAATPLAVAWGGDALAVAGEAWGEMLDASPLKGGEGLRIETSPGREATVWLSAGPLMEALGDLAEAMMEGVERVAPLESPPAGWMSWDELRFGLSAEDVLANARVLAERWGPSGAVVQIDDGWQGRNGDWRENERFAMGLGALVEEIHRLGLRAGLWLAPFLTALDSEVARAHPEWLLRGDDGGPLVELDLEHWGGKMGTLDPARPEVCAWLAQLGRRVGAWGFDYLKIDFLAHALTGRSHDESRPRAAAYREAIGALRRGIGRAIPIMGCGTPLGPGRGAFESARVTDDVVTGWDLLRTRLETMAVRHALHRRWWWNDPDNVVLREPFTLEQARLWASTVAVSGGPVFLGDDLRTLPEERWALAERIWPPVPLASRPLLARAAAGGDGLLVRGWVAEVGERRVAALLNHGEKTRRDRISAGDLRLGAGEACHVWDAWADRWLGVVMGEMDVEVSPASCRVLVFTPVRPEPNVIGATRHLLVGAVGVGEVKWCSGTHVLHIDVTDELPGRATELTVCGPAHLKPHTTGGAALVWQQLAREWRLVTVRVQSGPVEIGYGRT